MSIPATEAVVNTGLQALMPAPGAASAKADKQMFMDLLVAQLRYQDPLNPADSGEFLAQSAQFTSLEKLQEVADQTALLLSAQLAFGASSMVGHEVTYSNADGTTTSGTVDSVTFGVDGPTLTIGEDDVSLGAVLTVHGRAASSPTTEAPIGDDVPTDPSSTTL
ncbi:MAG: flagellar hook capping FlgD N-terminal domain-containing protein [Nocardioides sp.]